MKTTTAISPIMRKVLSIAKIQPMAMKASQMARIAPRIVHIIRPIYPVCARRPPQEAVMVTGGTRSRRQQRDLLCGGGSAVVAVDGDARLVEQGRAFLAHVREAAGRSEI